MTAGTDSKILKRLEDWERKEGPLSRALEFYHKLLRIQSEVRSSISPLKLSLTSEAINSRMTEGKPLLKFDDLTIDWWLLQKTFRDVIALLSSYSILPAEATDSLNKIGSSPALLRDVSRAWFEGTEFPPGVISGEIDGALVKSAILSAFKPFLVAYQEALLGSVNQELWRRAYCPICGGSPDFAFLEKEHGARWLLCSRCDAEWLFQRLECPYCGTKDQKALSYFVGEEKSHPYRLYVCSKCQTYLKAIDLRSAGLDVLLPLERVMTLDMDRQAQEKGYKPG